MNTLALYVKQNGCLVKVVNGTEIVCSPEHSLDVAHDILAGRAKCSPSTVVVHTLVKTCRTGLVLEQRTDGSFKSLPLAELLPLKYDGSVGTFRITVEFMPGENEEKK